MVLLQATLKDGNQSQRLLVLIKLLQPVGAAQRLLANLVEAHAAAEDGGAGPGEGSEADSEAALATARSTMAAAGVAGEGGPLVPRLDLHQVRGGAAAMRAQLQLVAQDMWVSLHAHGVNPKQASKCCESVQCSVL